MHGIPFASLSVRRKCQKKYKYPHPSQWLKLRQYIIPGESASTSPRIEEPVVVNPDTISNRASTKFGISLEKTNGRHPKKLIAIQLPATQTIPSLAKKRRVEFLQK
jgi:hypothetical protein